MIGHLQTLEKWNEKLNIFPSLAYKYSTFFACGKSRRKNTFCLNLKIIFPRIETDHSVFRNLFKNDTYNHLFYCMKCWVDIESKFMRLPNQFTCFILFIRQTFIDTFNKCDTIWIFHRPPQTQPSCLHTCSRSAYLLFA